MSDMINFWYYLNSFDSYSVIYKIRAQVEKITMEHRLIFYNN